MDSLTPVANQIQYPDFLKSYQNVLGIQQAKQNLAAGQLGLQKAQQDIDTGSLIQQQERQKATAAQQTQAEQQLLVKALSENKDPDGNPIKDENGETLIPNFSRFANKYLPLTGQKLTQDAVRTHSDKVGLAKSALELDSGIRNSAGGISGAYIGNYEASNKDIHNAYDQWAADHPERIGVVHYATNLIDGFAPPGPTRDKQLDRLRNLLTDPGKLFESQQPHIQEYTTPKQTVGFYNDNPRSATGVGALGPEVQVGLSKAQTGEEAVLDPQTNTYVYVKKDPNGNIISTRRAYEQPSPQGGSPTQPTAGSGGGPKVPPTMRPPAFSAPGEGEIRTNAIHHIADVRAQGNTVPTNRSNFDKVLDLSYGTKTGTGADWLQAAGGVLGTVTGTDTNSNYQTINAFLDRVAADQRKSLGLPETNSGMADAKSSSPSVAMAPVALRNKVRYMSGLNAATEAYRNGLDSLVGSGVNPDVSQVTNFQNSWAKNYEPMIFEAQEALRRQAAAKNGSPAYIEETQILNEFHRQLQSLPKAQREAIQRKEQNLELLSHGKLPNG